jgi:hypothetical protein
MHEKNSFGFSLNLLANSLGRAKSFSFRNDHAYITKRAIRKVSNVSGT